MAAAGFETHRVGTLRDEAAEPVMLELVNPAGRREQLAGRGEHQILVGNHRRRLVKSREHETTLDGEPGPCFPALDCRARAAGLSANLVKPIDIDALDDLLRGA